MIYHSLAQCSGQPCADTQASIQNIVLGLQLDFFSGQNDHSGQRYG
jgi:hypothetical protein